MLNAKEELKKINDEISKRKIDLSRLNDRLKAMKNIIITTEEYLKKIESQKESVKKNELDLNDRISFSRNQLNVLSEEVGALNNKKAELEKRYLEQLKAVSDERVLIEKDRDDAVIKIAEAKNKTREAEKIFNEANRIKEINDLENKKQLDDRKKIEEKEFELKEWEDRHKLEVKNFTDDIYDLRQREKRIEADKQIITEKILELKQKEQTFSKALDQHYSLIEENEIKKQKMDAKIVDAEKKQDALDRSIAALDIERKKMLNERMRLLKLIDDKKTDEAMELLTAGLKGKI